MTKLCRERFSVISIMLLKNFNLLITNSTCLSFPEVGTEDTEEHCDIYLKYALLIFI